MAKNLVIVESPAKAKTIKKYLGRDYEVIASMGHIRDLPKSTLGVDLENNFEPHYINIRKQSDVIKKLKAAAKDKSKIFLATDPDREGEAISWHLAHILSLKLEEKNRVTFNEITKSGVKLGMSNPRNVDIDLVNSQQARRIVDRIVGYKLSPFLWKKVKSGLSAGRVQSATVRLIVDRELDIRAFVPQEYHTIDATLIASDKKTFVASYYGVDKKEEIKTENRAAEILQAVQGQKFIVSDVKKGERKKSPTPPFITSTLQQEASRRLGFQARRTMKAAQELYEGVDVEGIGTVGLITYMRTDSLRISEEARTAGNEYIVATYGEKYIPKTPRYFKTKAKVQDGHEAIRPSIPSITPLQVKSSVSLDQYKLYKIIWERFMASLMSDTIHDTVSATITANNHNFKATGYTVRFDGYTVLYSDIEENAKALPILNVNDELKLKNIVSEQHFTQPPPRYTEASLIKMLEENGIGRPSTYAPTITTILARNYVEREAKQLKPTELGEITTKLMKEHFESVVDADFTASIEKDLDIIEEGNKEWRDVLKKFYSGFAVQLEKAIVETEGISYKAPDVETDIICDKCGKNMIIKSGRFGEFLACPGYPECKNTKKITKPMPGECPLCGGHILEKKSKKGKKFFGCEHNPTCAFLSWDEPIADKCPKCGKTMLKKSGKVEKIYCSNENCDNSK